MAEMVINMGPQHPMNHGLWNLKIRVDGETIVWAEAELGYLHRGYEKIMENKQYVMNIPLADRLCYAAAMSWSHLYCLSCENLFGITVPPRGQYIRVIALEIQRIASHLMWLGAYGPDLGALTGFLYAMRERELFLDLLEGLSGSRLTYSYTRIGGVYGDLPPNFEREALKAVSYLEKKLEDYERFFDGSKIFRMRTEGVGILRKEEAIAAGITGPNLRGSGSTQDIRKDLPYEAYDELDFEPAVAKAGDCYARYRVRMKEMRESCRLIREAFKKIPPGDYRVRSPRRAPKRDAYGRVEDPRGEAMMYIIGDGSDQPYRVKIRSPMFITMSNCGMLLKGYKVADIPSIMGSIDVCMGEADK